MRTAIAFAMALAIAAPGCASRKAAAVHFAIGATAIALAVVKDNDASSDCYDDCGGPESTLFSLVGVGFIVGGFIALINSPVEMPPAKPTAPLPLGPPGTVPSKPCGSF
jgi:hypothetical protein